MRYASVLFHKPAKKIGLLLGVKSMYHIGLRVEVFPLRVISPIQVLNRLELNLVNQEPVVAYFVEQKLTGLTLDFLFRTGGQ